MKVRNMGFEMLVRLESLVAGFTLVHCESRYKRVESWSMSIDVEFEYIYREGCIQPLINGQLATVNEAAFLAGNVSGLRPWPKSDIILTSNILLIGSSMA
jgi:hypothetical protein